MEYPEKIKNVWLIGIGGIGMSAIARYFFKCGKKVAGYDLTPSPLTDSLIDEGMDICFSDDPSLIIEEFQNPETTLVVYTPAVDSTHRQLVWFREKGFSVLKRSRVLGEITGDKKSICIAGTHGKTSISTITAYLFRESMIGGTAFLGGISKNYNTNFFWDNDSPYTILEADEYDRSFLQLTPYCALVSSVDADHLDIYGDKFHMQQAFIEFGRRVVPGGILLIKEGLNIGWKLNKKVKLFTYSLKGKSDYHVSNIRLIDGLYHFTMHTPEGEISDLISGIPGLVNLENTVAAIALALLNGVTSVEIKKSLPFFKGVKRRFDVVVNDEKFKYIDDYAHHPEEISATLKSIRHMYPGMCIIGAFQPHLYSRTKDFAPEFAKSLSLLDELYLIDIYPAREQPLKGVDSRMIGRYINNIPVYYCARNELVDRIKIKPNCIIITMGAGDIDRVVEALKSKIELLLLN